MNHRGSAIALTVAAVAMTVGTDVHRAYADQTGRTHPLAHSCSKAHRPLPPKIKRKPTIADPEPDPDTGQSPDRAPAIDEADLVHFAVTPTDVELLTQILREQITADFDLLEDQLALKGECDQNVVERVGYAMRLDSRIARQRQSA